MQKHILFGIGGLVLGLAIGFFAANKINQDGDRKPAVVSDEVTTIPPDQVLPQDGMQADVAETIAKAEAEPQNFALQMQTGDMYAKIGRFDKAVEFYKKGLAVKPDDFNANVVTANALFDSARFEEAGTYYSKAVEMNPKDINARTDLGTTFVERKTPDYERAIKEFLTALEIEPKHEPTLYYLGIAYFRKGDTENAQKALKQLEQANPTSELIGRFKQNISPK
jgi:tetratricopeptide (TPR) repeat protein